MLSYEPRFKLLNNGNVVGLRFGFRAVPTWITGSRVRILRKERFFPNLDDTLLHRTFHVPRHFFQSAGTKLGMHLFEKNVTVHLFYFVHFDYLIK